MNEWNGIKLIQSPFAYRTSPVRKHKKRRNQSEAYHYRVQKKWTKRFGTKKEPCAFIIKPQAFDLFGHTGLNGPQTVVIPPEWAVQLRNIAA